MQHSAASALSRTLEEGRERRKAVTQEESSNDVAMRKALLWSDTPHAPASHNDHLRHPDVSMQLHPWPCVSARSAGEGCGGGSAISRGR
jgi:hypothetical protein